MRILLGGDFHGNTLHVAYLYKMATDFNVDRVFSLGDYGYWEHTDSGKDYLDFCGKIAMNTGIPLYFLDGNHDNHTKLRKDYSMCVIDDGMWMIREGLSYSPRGNRFTWDGVRFMTFGGAYSIDKAYRRPGTSWWPEETITPEEVASAGTGKVDILLSHDLPAGIDMRAIMQHRGFDYRNIPDSEQNRRRLREVCDVVRPDYLFHGHYHLNYTQDLPIAFGNHLLRVRGLACDDMGPGSWTIIDTEDYK